MRFALLFLLFLAPFVAAHNTEQTRDLGHDEISEASYSAVAYGTIFLSIILYFTLTQTFKSKTKRIIFSLIAVPSLVVTVYLLFITFQANTNSVTEGPVHWHVDFELYHCGESVELIDPTGIMNRIGTPVLHEHGDNRIHVEGVVREYEEVNLHNFFHVIGGSINTTHIELPTNDGVVNAENGDLCNGEPGVLQAFLYRTEGDMYTQTKLTNFEEYVPAPHAYVPPGDCVIIEFSPLKETTEHLCTTYRVAEQNGEIQRGNTWQ